MTHLGLLMILASAPALAVDGTVPERELSVAGVEIGQSPAQVTKLLGNAVRKVDTGEFVEYHYSRARVSVGENMVYGVYSDHPHACTPAGLCPGDGLDKMRFLYGPPVEADRETGLFFEYYATGASCWLQISAKGNLIASIAVACQP